MNWQPSLNKKLSWAWRELNHFLWFPSLPGHGGWPVTCATSRDRARLGWDQVVPVCFLSSEQTAAQYENQSAAGWRQWLQSMNSTTQSPWHRYELWAKSMLSNTKYERYGIMLLYVSSTQIRASSYFVSSVTRYIWKVTVGNIAILYHQLLDTFEIPCPSCIVSSVARYIWKVMVENIAVGNIAVEW